MAGHVAGCERCEREVADLRLVAQMLEGIPPEFLDVGPPPPDVAERLLSEALRRIDAAEEPPDV